MEISAGNIGVIKTRRAFRYAIVDDAVVSTLTGGLTGLIANGSDDPSVNYNGYRTSTGDDVAIGAIGGAVIGGIIGAIVDATKKKETVVINGSVNEWQRRKRDIDLMPENNRRRKIDWLY